MKLEMAEDTGEAQARGVTTTMEQQTPSNLEVSVLANELRRNLPDLFREVFAPDFEPGLASEEDDINGVGKMSATRTIEHTVGNDIKVMSLVIKPTESSEILNDPVFVLQQVMLRIHRNEGLHPMYSYMGVKRDGTKIEPKPTGVEAAEEIRKLAKRLKPFRGVSKKLTDRR